MKKLLFAAALLTLTASAASAGISLNWNQCYPFAPTTGLNRLDNCYVCPNTADYRLVPSFDAPSSIPNFVATRSIVDVQMSGPVPDWWRFESGGCRAGSLAVQVYNGNVTQCPDAMFGNNLTGPVLVVFNAFGGNANYIRIIADLSRDNDFAMTAGQHYVGEQLFINHAKTTADCDLTPTPDTTPVCLGCNTTTATLVLQEVQLYVSTVPAVPPIVLTSVDVGERNFVNFRGGAGAPVPTQNKSWGAVKALYR